MSDLEFENWLAMPKTKELKEAIKLELEAITEAMLSRQYAPAEFSGIMRELRGEVSAYKGILVKFLGEEL